ncbi:MAG TPA: hypothetical protein VLL95_00835, partial [Phnomibacter sp.]|nr:hypothetical protein [Phnomibacter sp.]
MKRRTLMMAVALLPLMVWSQPTSNEPEKDKAVSVTAGTESVVKHSIGYKGGKLSYTTTAGYLGIRNDTGKVIAKVFYTYYQKDNEKVENRPIIFCFNGGPGSSSVWLH